VWVKPLICTAPRRRSSLAEGFPRGVLYDDIYPAYRVLLQIQHRTHHVGANAEAAPAAIAIPIRIQADHFVIQPLPFAWRLAPQIATIVGEPIVH